MIFFLTAIEENIYKNNTEQYMDIYTQSGMVVNRTSISDIFWPKKMDNPQIKYIYILIE